MKHFKLKITRDSSSLPELASLMTWSPDYCSCDSTCDTMADSGEPCTISDQCSDYFCDDYGPCPDYIDCQLDDTCTIDYCNDGCTWDYAA